MAKEIILAVCSTGSRLKLAVFDGKKFYCAQRRVFNQEEPLFSMINKLLKGAGLGSVKIFCAVRGPGRFTGIRIGLTLGRVLEALAGAKIYSATLFEIMVLQAFESADYKNWSERSKKPKIAVLMRAFKDEYFCQAFQVTGHKSQSSGGAVSNGLWPTNGQVTSQNSQVTGNRLQVTGHGSPDIRSSAFPPHSTADPPDCLAGSLQSRTVRLRRNRPESQPSAFFKAVAEPQWLKAPEMKEYLSALGPELFVIGDAEEDPSVYTLAPAYCVKAGPGISRIIPVYLIKTALALKNRNAAPLYLKPARYELDQKAGRLVSR